MIKADEIWFDAAKGVKIIDAIDNIVREDDDDPRRRDRHVETAPATLPPGPRSGDDRPRRRPEKTAASPKHGPETSVNLELPLTKRPSHSSR